MISFQLATLPSATGLCGGEKEGDSGEAPSARSKLYDQIDVDQLGRACAARFERNASFQSASNLKITPPGRWFKSFRVKGEIPAERLDQAFEALSQDIDRLVEASGVTVTGKGSDPDQRPIALLKAMFPTYTVKISSIRGYHVAYEGAESSGEIDLFALQFTDRSGGDLKWCVLCAIHEPAE